MTELFTIDTNILIYAIDNADSGKQQKADSILERMISSQSVLPLQCLNEFYSATTKKGLLTSEQAQRVVERSLSSFRIVQTSPEDLVRAMKIEELHHVQFDDALLWVTSYRAGCTVFLTEDGQFGRDIGGITLHNPFAPGFDLDELLG